MSYNTYLPARTSSYSVSTLDKDVAPLVVQVAQQSALVAEAVKAANDEMAVVGAHASIKMAQLTQACTTTRNLLTTNGARTEVFSDFQDKVLQVTGQNMIALANTAQKEMGVQAMRAVK